MCYSKPCWVGHWQDGKFGWICTNCRLFTPA